PAAERLHRRSRADRRHRRGASRSVAPAVQLDCVALQRRHRDRHRRRHRSDAHALLARDRGGGRRRAGDLARAHRSQLGHPREDVTVMADEPVTAPEQPGGDAIVSTDPLADAQRERDDYYDRWMRKAAEFDNYRKRVERERREQSDQAVVNLLLDLLLVVDDFDLALTAHGSESGGAYRKGIELIHAKLYDVLKRYNVRPIEALGADFDP